MLEILQANSGADFAARGKMLGQEDVDFKSRKSQFADETGDAENSEHGGKNQKQQVVRGEHGGEGQQHDSKREHEARARDVLPEGSRPISAEFAQKAHAYELTAPGELDSAEDAAS